MHEASRPPLTLKINARGVNRGIEKLISDLF